MRVLRQLLREFWLPLLLGAGWTAFNFYDKPLSQWSTRTILNAFGPTFFFMSWLVAQWYRVRKQQRVEEGLDTLHAGLRALQSPLLPCGLFLTLRIEAPDEDLERVFGEQPGYRWYGPEVPMREPPYGLPPGVRDGRLHYRYGYLDYRDGVVEAAGVVRTEHPGYNTLHRTVCHTACVFGYEAGSKGVSENEPLFTTPAVTLEIYVGGRPKSSRVPPTFVLKSNPMKTGSVVGAFALDNTVAIDHAIKALAVSPPDATGYSVSSLKGAFFRLTLDFFFIKHVASLPRESWPTLHNLQLWLGGSGRQLLTFPFEDLETQVTRDNPKSLLKGDAMNPQILLEKEVVDNAFDRNFRSVA